VIYLEYWLFFIDFDLIPFMTFIFVSLPVIPKLRLNTYGVVDVDKHEIVPAVF
jgi:adenine deaminase